MRALIVLTALFLFPSFALANIYDECLSAIEQNDQGAAQEYVETIQRFKLVPIPNREKGIKCLGFATGEEWVYDTVTDGFSTKAQAEANLKEQRELSALEAEKRQSEARWREKLETQAAVEAEKAKIEQQKQIDEARAAENARTLLVWSAVIDACNELYSDDPTQALTNSVCVDLFMETGLPKED